MLHVLHKDWNNKFSGGSLDILRNLILAREDDFDRINYYAKTIPIIQSSGTGKSRLLDEISKEF